MDYGFPTQDCHIRWEVGRLEQDSAGERKELALEYTQTAIYLLLAVLNLTLKP